MATAVPMVETYRALRRLEIGGGVFREFGDMIPEAEEWTPSIRAVYLRSGFIERAYIPEAEYNAFMESTGLPEVPEPEVPDGALTVPEPTPSVDSKEKEGETQDTPEVSETPTVVEGITEEDIEDLGDPEPAPAEETGNRKRVVKRKV